MEAHGKLRGTQAESEEAATPGATGAQREMHRCTELDSPNKEDHNSGGGDSVAPGKGEPPSDLPDFMAPLEKEERTAQMVIGETDGDR